MHHTFADMIAYASQAQTLYPGEVIGSGTAAGGSGIELERWLAPGDIVELEIEGIGVLRNIIGRKSAAPDGGALEKTSAAPDGGALARKET